MVKDKMSMFTRYVYGLVGLVGLMSVIWAIMSGEAFMSMPLWSQLAFIIAVIGSLNWGIVSITGNRTKDLFGFMGL